MNGVERCAVQVSLLPHVVIYGVHHVFSIFSYLPHRTTKRVASGVSHDRDSITLPAQHRQLHVLDGHKRRESRVDVVERKHLLKIPLILPRQKVIIHVHLSHLVHRQRRVNLAIHSQLSKRVGQRAQVRRVWMRNQNRVNLRRDRRQRLEHVHIKFVIPSTIEQDVTAIDGDVIAHRLFSCAIRS